MERESWKSGQHPSDPIHKILKFLVLHVLYSNSIGNRKISQGRTQVTQHQMFSILLSKEMHEPFKLSECRM